MGAVGQSRKPGEKWFTRAWSKAIASTSYVAMSREEIEEFLGRLTHKLAAALLGEPFCAAPAAEVGAALVEANFTTPATLSKTIGLLGQDAIELLGLVSDEVLRTRIVELQAGVANGFVGALRDRTLREHEEIRQAVLDARMQLAGVGRRPVLDTDHSGLDVLDRDGFLRRLDEVFSSIDPDLRVGLVHLDIDAFKVINNSLGHKVGERLLGAVAGRLAECMGDLPAQLARIGGDEFAILTVSDQRLGDSLVSLAEKILAELITPLSFDGHELAISVSMGIVERPILAGTAVELMRDADITLYRAKSEGRGRWATYDEEHNAREVSRYTLVASMLTALERNEFYVEYQPLVRLSDKTVVGAEALVRWMHPEMGKLSPDRFIGLAEETGLIVPLGRWVLQQACNQAKSWQDKYGTAGPFVSVNLAVRQLWDPNLVSDVAFALESSGLEPAQLQLELTESAIMGTAQQPLNALRALSEMGVRIAIDDFGTGYSNLAYLRDLPVHELKIAGSFMAGLRVNGSNQVDERIVSALVALAHGLKLTVTAEGVETPAEAARLSDIGCDLGQGWYFAKPGPPENLDCLLAAAV
ncbi:bifunctional diguanylate cyclase/phosphodiesterase [Pseudonocardiaceae bacterium YIM PH 21723]|nr:bifunctional diguanylate cyclase/phosphodiesterase [Pseudonocardiaceae bacterium YIM PH 21723]